MRLSSSSDKTIYLRTPLKYGNAVLQLPASMIPLPVLFLLLFSLTTLLHLHRKEFRGYKDMANAILDTLSMVTILQPDHDPSLSLASLQTAVSQHYPDTHVSHFPCAVRRLRRKGHIILAGDLVILSPIMKPAL
jgi:hypothetical protein